MPLSCVILVRVALCVCVCAKNRNVSLKIHVAVVATIIKLAVKARRSSCSIPTCNVNAKED